MLNRNDERILALKDFSKDLQWTIAALRGGNGISPDALRALKKILARMKNEVAIAHIEELIQELEEVHEIKNQ